MRVGLMGIQVCEAGEAMSTSDDAMSVLSTDPSGKLGLAVKLGRRAAKGVNLPIGFAKGTDETAFDGMLKGGGHAMKYLVGTLTPDRGSLQSRRDAFKALAIPILENPMHAAPWSIGGTDGRAFLGNVGGRNLAIVVSTAGPYQGKVFSAFYPDDKQLSILLSK